MRLRVEERQKDFFDSSKAHEHRYVNKHSTRTVPLKLDRRASEAGGVTLFARHGVALVIHLGRGGEGYNVYPMSPYNARVYESVLG